MFQETKDITNSFVNNNTSITWVPRLAILVNLLAI